MIFKKFKRFAKAEDGAAMVIAAVMMKKFSFLKRMLSRSLICFAARLLF